MTALLTPPPLAPSSGLRPFRWTVQLFHQLGDAGYFRGRRAKLIRGTLLEQGMMNPAHAEAGEKAEEAVRVAFGPGWRVRVQKPLVLSLDTDPEPDIAVVRGAPGALVHPTTAELVVEISDTTLDADLTEMAELYATAGILDHWVLNVDGRRLLVFRDPVPLPAGPGATAYRTRLTLSDTDTVSPLAAPAATIRVTDLLP
jgi:Uma2 family endonuclease